MYLSTRETYKRRQRVAQPEGNLVHEKMVTLVLVTILVTSSCNLRPNHYNATHHEQFGSSNLARGLCVTLGKTLLFAPLLCPRSRDKSYVSQSYFEQQK